MIDQIMECDSVSTIPQDINFFITVASGNNNSHPLWMCFVCFEPHTTCIWECCCIDLLHKIQPPTLVFRIVELISSFRSLCVWLCAWERERERKSWSCTFFCSKYSLLIFQSSSAKPSNRRVENKQIQFQTRRWSYQNKLIAILVIILSFECEDSYKLSIA